MSPAPLPVPVHRGQDLPHGFRGEVHPLLAGGRPLEVTARWSKIRPGRALEYGYFPAPYYKPFVNLKAAQPTKSYAAGDFSTFLPAEIESAGQMWSLDPAKITPFLRQLHGGGSTNLQAPGRRAGPNGAFALLRAVSANHLDIVFRVHAEFQVDTATFVTPSCFLGRLVLNRQTGDIDRFEMKIPQDKPLNVTLTLVRPDVEALIDIIHVESMELSGGDTDVEKLVWDESVDLQKAHTELKEVFFRFMDIDWVPPTEALAKAKELGKPVMALVLWGCLDEQSC
jgi:hypothetical protein